MLSMMLVVSCLGFVIAGILFFLTFIGFSLPFLVLLSIMMVEMLLLLILLSGLLVLFPRGVVWFMRFVTGLFCPGLLVFGTRNGFRFQHLPSVLMTLLIGPTLLVFWLNGLLFLRIVFTWPVCDLQILGLVVFPMWNCSFFMSFGLVRGSPWRRLTLVIFVQGAHFQCRLFLLVQALIFGVHVVLLVLLCGLFACYLECWGGLSLAPLVLITAGCVILGGKSGHGLTSRPREVPLSLFLNELLELFQYPPGSGRALLAGTLPLRYCATRFACKIPTWRLPAFGHVTGMVAGGDFVDCAADEVSWVSSSGLGMKRIRLNRKTPAHLVVSMVQSRPRIWKRLRHVFLSLITRGGVVIRMMVGAILFTSGLGLGIFLSLRAGPRLQACMIFELAWCCSRVEMLCTYTHPHTCPEQQQHRRLSQACSFLLCLHLSRWTSASSPGPELLSAASSGDCAHGGDMSSSRSLRPWPRTLTTQPHGDRRRPGPGRRITRCTSRRRSGRILLPRRQALSTFPWTSKMCLPPAPGQTGCLPCLGRMSGCCGTPLSRWVTVCPLSRASTRPCLSSRGSKCPRSLSKTGSRSEPCFACRCRWNSWWKCRLRQGTHLRWLPCKPLGGGQHRLCLSSFTPPGQGGIQILAAATVAEAMDVSVTAQLQFQQFFVEYVEVPQLQFIDSVVGVSVASQRQGSQCKLCRRRSFARCLSWIGWDVPVVVQRQAWMVQTVQSGGTASAVLVVLDAFGGSEGFFDAFCAIFRAPPVIRS